MNKRFFKRIDVLSFMKTIPIVSTEQVALFFSEHGSPLKRASELLKELEEEELIEGQNRFQESKVWRLSKKGRELLRFDSYPVPMKTRKLKHMLSIGDVFLDLSFTGNLDYFTFEPRFDFVNKHGKIRRFSPDAEFSYLKEKYFLEVQRTPIKDERWAEKWNVSKEFLEIQNETFIMPKILVISEQKASIVKTGSEGLDLIIEQDCRPFIANQLIS